MGGEPELGRQFAATSPGMVVPIRKSSRGEKFFQWADVKMP
jgi:hypothetical protein